jgi:hypothetical protein
MAFKALVEDRDNRRLNPYLLLVGAPIYSCQYSTAMYKN